MFPSSHTAYIVDLKHLSAGMFLREKSWLYVSCSVMQCDITCLLKKMNKPLSCQWFNKSEGDRLSAVAGFSGFFQRQTLRYSLLQEHIRLRSSSHPTQFHSTVHCPQRTPSIDLLQERAFSYAEMLSVSDRLWLSECSLSPLHNTPPTHTHPSPWAQLPVISLPLKSQGSWKCCYVIFSR